jgi:hypothetical protein
MTHDPALRSLHSLREALDQLQDKRMPVHAFCQTWRAQTVLLAALPPRYSAVSEDLLGRLEAGSLFTEESCSFSQEDLQANLAVWLDKAAQALSRK